MYSESQSADFFLSITIMFYLIMQSFIPAPSFNDLFLAVFNLAYFNNSLSFYEDSSILFPISSPFLLTNHFTFSKLTLFISQVNIGDYSIP